MVGPDRGWRQARLFSQLESDVVNLAGGLWSGGELLFPGLGAVVAFLLFLQANGFVEGDALLSLLLFETLDFFADVSEVGILGDALLGAFPQVGEIGLNPIELLISGCRDGVPFEGIVQRGLTDVDVIADRGENEVGGHASELGGGAAGAIEFADGDLERAGIVVHEDTALAQDGSQLKEGLHGAFAVGGRIADDESAAIILQGTREDFRGRSAEAAGEHDEGAIIADGTVRIIVLKDAPVVIAHLNDRSFLNEESCQVDGLFQRAPAVAAQVEDDPGDFFLHQLMQELGHVGGGASLLGARSPTLQFEA